MDDIRIAISSVSRPRRDALDKSPRTHRGEEKFSRDKVESALIPGRRVHFAVGHDYRSACIIDAIDLLMMLLLLLLLLLLVPFKRDQRD